MYVVFAAPKGLPDEVLQRLKAALDDLKRDKAFSEFAVEKLRMRPVEFGMAHAAQYMEGASKRYAAQPPADDFKTRAIRTDARARKRVSHAVRGGSARGTDARLMQTRPGSLAAGRGCPRRAPHFHRSLL